MPPVHVCQIHLDCICGIRFKIGLDCTVYLAVIILQAVHSGEDLSAAIDTVLGYTQESMKGKKIDVPPLPGASNELTKLLRGLRHDIQSAEQQVSGQGFQLSQ